MVNVVKKIDELAACWTRRPLSLRAPTQQPSGTGVTGVRSGGMRECWDHGMMLFCRCSGAYPAKGANDEGRAAGATGQIQGQGWARSQAMTNEGAEQTLDVSPPRPPPERPAHSVCEERNAGTLDCSPKSANFTEKPTAKLRGCYWGSCTRMTFFLFYMESVARFFF